MKKVGIIFVIMAAITSVAIYKILYEQPEVIVTKAVDIPANASLHKISYILAREGILHHRRALIVLAKLKGSSGKAQSGEFLFPVPSSPKTALKILIHGTPVLHQVTIPEGFNAKEMAPLFETENIVPVAEFMKAFKDPVLLKNLQVPGKSFEGYLFPETYSFPKNEKIENILRAMMAQLQNHMLPEDRAKAKALGWSDYEWITFASVIEKETGKADEYPLVSSVFHNRLNKKMRLQSDPTVIYGITNYDGNIKKIHLQTDTPYNTYTRYGLPVGPISNPGAGALHAAVNPANTGFYYFVGNREGSHVFTETYEEHLKAVKQYQLTPR